MKNKKGFVSMTLVYTFLIVFLFIMLAILEAYSEKIKYTSTITEDVNKKILDDKVNRNKLFNKIIEDNHIINGNGINYSNPADTRGESGLYYLSNNSTDDNNDGFGDKIYFYRGNVKNNFVKLSNMCFRIIRTTEEKNIKMIYYGNATISDTCTSEYTLSYANYYDISSHNAYIGLKSGETDVSAYSSDDDKYMHTHTNNQENIEITINNSNVYTALTNWYENAICGYNPETRKCEYNFEKYVYNETYCNDSDRDAGNGYIGDTYYAFNRISSRTPAPILSCKNAFDRYSLSIFAGGTNTSGNSLKYPVGLITADEVAFAGGTTSENNTKYYLRFLNNYWTMTPSRFTESKAKVFYVDENGLINESEVTETLSVRPVITLTNGVLVSSGNGTSSNPYIIREE